MLILSRTRGEALVFGDELTLTVSWIEADSVIVTLNQHWDYCVVGLPQPGQTGTKTLQLDAFCEILPGVEISLVKTDVERGRVRLGIVAPTEMPVHRKELLDALRGQGG